MARGWTPRQAPPPTSITEIARRYHAAAVALAQTLGLSLAEVLSQHRESVTAIFIESGRCDLRLPAGVPLPHVADAHTVSDRKANGAPTVSESSPIDANGHTPPLTVVPTDAVLPCGGMAIPALTPAQLAMLVSKVARLVSDGADQWVSLLHALQVERARRLERGRQGTTPPAENV
jgi:hypothetical protein